MPQRAAGLRRAVARGRRVVVKVGSSSLTSAGGGHLDPGALSLLVDTLAAHRLAGHQVVLVSSGAIAAGIGPLGLAARPRDLATQQAAASVGQGALVAAYQQLFGEHGLTVGQVLLTADDVTRRSHYTNARRTLERLLELGVVPVVNENDTVATHEIRFGDNDRLAALVADLVAADGLLLLTDVDALYDGPPSQMGTRRVPFVGSVADLQEVRIGGTGSAVGSGGMVTKVEAAGIAGAAGVPTVLTRLDGAAQVLAPGGDHRGVRAIRRGRPGRPGDLAGGRGRSRPGQLRVCRLAPAPRPLYQGSGRRAGCALRARGRPPRPPRRPLTPRVPTFPPKAPSCRFAPVVFPCEPSRSLLTGLGLTTT